MNRKLNTATRIGEFLGQESEYLKKLRTAVHLYELLEVQDNTQAIKDTILEIDDLNEWNINIHAYYRDGESIISSIINPEQSGNISILEFVIWLIIGGDNWDIEFEMYPMVDEIVEFLVLNGAKSNPRLYNSWLDVGEEYFDEDDQTIIKYKKIKKYLGLFMRTQKAQQRLALAKGIHDPSSTYSRNSRFVPGIAEMISNHLSQMPYNPEVAIRIKEEEVRDHEHLQKAEQRLALSKLLGMIPDYDTAIDVGENIGREPYNPEVSRRMREEEKRDIEHLNWLQSFSQYGGRRRNRTRKKRYQFY